MSKLKCVLVALAMAICGQAAAQDYPNRTVKLIVPYSAGGSTDVLARVIGQRLSDSLGQPFVVVNQPGAGGISGTLLVTKAPADGYTLLVSDMSQVVINPFLFSNLPYDPVKDLAPVSLVATIPLYFVVQPGKGIDTLPDLVKMAKAKPGDLSYGSAGVGSIHHIVMESFRTAASLNIVHVPYKGSGQSTSGFLSGQVPILVSGLSAIAPHVKSGKGKLVAITSGRRSGQTPDVPSVSEMVSGFDFSSEFGILATAGTPPEIVTKLSNEIAKALKAPGTMDRLGPMGMEAVGSSPAEYAENIRRNLERFAQAVKISGAKAD
jgi:tripartite-type tricarboxylate transporter receptor subunit TctC